MYRQIPSPATTTIPEANTMVRRQLAIYAKATRQEHPSRLMRNVHKPCENHLDVVLRSTLSEGGQE